jgi:hypothetical protein
VSASPFQAASTSPTRSPRRGRGSTGRHADRAQRASGLHARDEAERLERDGGDGLSRVDGARAPPLHVQAALAVPRVVVREALRLGVEEHRREARGRLLEQTGEVRRCARRAGRGDGERCAVRRVDLEARRVAREQGCSGGRLRRARRRRGSEAAQRVRPPSAAGHRDAAAQTRRRRQLELEKHVRRLLAHPVDRAVVGRDADRGEGAGGHAHRLRPLHAQRQQARRPVAGEVHLRQRDLAAGQLRHRLHQRQPEQARARDAGRRVVDGARAARRIGRGPAQPAVVEAHGDLGEPGRRMPVRTHVEQRVEAELHRAAGRRQLHDPLVPDAPAHVGLDLARANRRDDVVHARVGGERGGGETPPTPALLGGRLLRGGRCRDARREGEREHLHGDDASTHWNEHGRGSRIGSMRRRATGPCVPWSIDRARGVAHD